MNTLSRIQICAVILTLLSTLFTIGCKNPFNPKQSSLSVHSSWLPNNSPENVLKNLENAYNRKDLDLYTSILDKNFHFELISSEAPELNAGIDLDGDGYPDSWWGYQTEIEYHTNLFRDGSTDGRFPPPDEILLLLSIPPEELWLVSDVEGQDGWRIITCDFTLTLKFFTMVNQTASGYATFYLKPENGKWSLAIWRDESFI
ncbi:MAG: hypothetical protein PHR06_10945 [Candidatus Cloacimonetes bacterium]|nr:hypothetical protein [Candidatus Cloacimonadota bacterium]